MKLVAVAIGSAVLAALVASTGTGVPVPSHADQPRAAPVGRPVAGRIQSTAAHFPDPARSMAKAVKPLQRFTVIMSGDVLLHNTLWTQAQRDAQAAGRRGYDFRPLLAGVRRAVSAADLAICHLETPLGPTGGPFSSYPIFNVPPQIAKDLAWVGYDACSTASNHTLDGGVPGVRRTLAALDAAGLAHDGSARTSWEADRVRLLDAGPAQVALLSYTYGLNGFVRPADQPWIVDLIDPDQIRDDAARARRAGADVVLVALHWGNEYQRAPSDVQRGLAARLLASPDIDLVYGHHAHVVQPFERIGDKWVAYGLGNHVAEQTVVEEATHEGVMARFEFTAATGGRWRVTRAQYLPTAVSRSQPYRLVDLTRLLADDRVQGASRLAFQAAYQHIATAVDSLGAGRDGLEPADEQR